jgi:V8-like Glu-specific endopeptidase
VISLIRFPVTKVLSWLSSREVISEKRNKISMMNSSRSLFIACLLVAITGCGTGGPDMEDAEALEGLGQELIIGNDDRSLVTSDMTTAYPWKAVAAVRNTPTITRSSCSAFKVGPRHLLSAAHCFYNRKADGSMGLIVSRDSFRLVFSQFGSGNSASNMPVDGRKIAIQSIYVPPAFITSAGTVDDWALIRISDSDATKGWFQANTPWTEAQIDNLTSRFATGFPLQDLTCARSPKADKLCGGYQYYSDAHSFVYTPSFITTQTDWDMGQSGGAVFGSRLGTTQRAAIGIINSSSSTRSIVRRLTKEITNKVCEQVRAFPSAVFKTHECGA